jgi:hypothetical protein
VRENKNRAPVFWFVFTSSLAILLVDFSHIRPIAKDQQGRMKKTQRHNPPKKKTEKLNTFCGKKTKPASKPAFMLLNKNHWGPMSCNAMQKNLKAQKAE